MATATDTKPVIIIVARLRRDDEPTLRDDERTERVETVAANVEEQACAPTST
jgi:hypothetical protein